MNQPELFSVSALHQPSGDLVNLEQCGHRKDLDQYVTPEYYAELLVETLGIGPNERVIDAGCGRGAFLKYVPQHAVAYGIEIDAQMAEYARLNTGRPVIVGDFKQVEIPFDPTLIVGNPPFSKTKEVNPWLRRIHQMLKDEGNRVAWILPSYHFSWASPVMEWAQMFSMRQGIVPREIFPNLSCQLNWVVFTREHVRKMWGFLFYPEVAEMRSVSPEAKLILVHGRPGKSAWRAVIDEAIRRQGRPTTLREIYEFVDPRRPFEENANWKQQIRKNLYTHHYTRVGEAWKIAA